jgi:hypothetical protein
MLRWLQRLLGPWRATPAAAPAYDPDLHRSPPHPANVPGPFYVQDGCCLSCAVWMDVAPDLLAWHEEGDARGEYSHCYVARQPETDAEFERMKQAMKVGEVDCIRVHACRPQWTERLREAGLGHHIDPPEGPAKTHPLYPPPPA